MCVYQANVQLKLSEKDNLERDIICYKIMVLRLARNLLGPQQAPFEQLSILNLLGSVLEPFVDQHRYRYVQLLQLGGCQWSQHAARSISDLKSRP